MASFTDDEGVVIETVEWPVASPRAVVQISHGIAEHSGRYAALAADLNLAGFTVVADDHRGHGVTGARQSVAETARGGRLGPGGLRSTVAAIERFRDLTKARFPDLPLILIAHSWGSLLAQIALNDRPDAYDGVVLSGTAYRIPGWMDAGDLNRKHRHLGTSGVEWLSRDPAVGEAWLADPLKLDATTMQMLGVRDTLRLIGRPAKDLPSSLPLLIQVGSDDTLGGRRSAERLAKSYRQRSGLHDVSVHVYEGARHEVYNETNRDEVIADLVTWIEEHVLQETRR